MGNEYSRASELRRRHQRILWWSFGVAVLIHMAVFALNPGWVREQLTWFTVHSFQDPNEDRSLAMVDVSFLPPEIFRPDGSLRREPSDRFLEAEEVDLRGIQWSQGCEWVEADRPALVEGEVQLEVRGSGRVRGARIARSSGDGCLDEMLVAIAGALWYRWIPNDTTPAPVKLLQPIVVEAAS